MNEALVTWLMTPDAPEDLLTVGDFLRRPEWHAWALCRGRGAMSSGERPARCVRSVLRQRWPILTSWVCGAGPRTQSVGRSADSGRWRDELRAGASLTPQRHRRRREIRDERKVTDSVVSSPSLVRDHRDTAGPREIEPTGPKRHYLRTTGDLWSGYVSRGRCGRGRATGRRG